MIKDDGGNLEIWSFMGATAYFYKVNELSLTLIVCFPTHASS